jgi:GDP/UDP-N,N'-diacetylbacillosamine 2-epimerase (hydrolysing)
MKKIAIFTTSRAEFGLLSNLLDAIVLDDALDYLLFAGGSHHLNTQGRSIQEMRSMEYHPIPFDFFLSSDNEKTLTQSMGVELFQLSEIFSKYNFDFVTVLGDRIELLSIVHAAIIFRKPIIHIHGGEVTEGALDEQIRHMITKASHIHFCVCKEYQQNVMKMGEEDWRVHDVGALGIDSITKREVKSQAELFSKYSLKVNLPTVLMTYHPVTLEQRISAETQIQNVFSALEYFKFQLVITAPNIDSDNHYLFDIIQENIINNSDYHFIESMGIVNYQSMLRCVEFTIGNSSSGILEVPFFKIPTVNIGDRQKGRIRHDSVIDVDYSTESIKEGILRALDPEFRSSLLAMDYKFGDGHAAERIVKILKGVEIDQHLIRKKLDFVE